MKEKHIPTIVITSMTRYTYFQWLLLGLYELADKGVIRLKFKNLSLFEKLTLLSNRKVVITGFLDFIKKIKLNRSWVYKDSYCLTGYTIYKGKRVSFCVDSADSPFLFNLEGLKHVDAYFKMQCPKDLSTKGYKLTENVIIPWCDHEHKQSGLELTDKGERRTIDNFSDYKNIIYPLMIGVRRISWGNSKKALRDGYNNLLLSRRVCKQKKLMCYFGSAKGPKPLESEIIDYDKEASIVYNFKNLISHPNEKRAIAADLINTFGEGYDGRVISRGESDSKGEKEKSLVVPLEEFSNFVSQFEYNLNISGYRLSIPNRFIDSFICGTAIITDKLSVKWYKPFGKSVFETVEMGYLPNNEVDWDKFKNDLKHLPPISSDDVISEFEENWAPEPVAKYFLTVLLPEYLK